VKSHGFIKFKMETVLKHINNLLNQGKIISVHGSVGFNGTNAFDSCERILADEFKDYPESAFYMIGTIDEAKKK
jgi:F0F1-type ATP synthase beta subunit